MTDKVASFRDISAEQRMHSHGPPNDLGSGGQSPSSNSLVTSERDGMLSTSLRDDSSPVSIGNAYETAYASRQLSASSVSSIPSPSSTAFYPHYQVASAIAAPPAVNTQSLANWETYYTDSGKPYYYNTITGITQWEKPTELQQPLNQKSDAPVLPACQPLGTDPGKSGPFGANLFMYASISLYHKFRFYLPPAWSEPELFSAFQAYGTIVSARVQRDAFGRSRGYGFISYDVAESAQGAIRGMDGAAGGGKRLKVSVKTGDSTDENPMQVKRPSRIGFQ